jgi:hypothetical protein
MSTVVIERQGSLVEERQGSLLDIFDYESGADISCSKLMGTRRGLTLDDLVTSVWEGLAMQCTVRCPACGGAMVSRSAAGTAVSAAEAALSTAEGDCLDCGVRLA